MPRLGVITDEISEDLEHALAVCTELGIRDVELRSVWNTSVVELPDDDLARVEALLREGGFATCAIASPYLKCHIADDGAAAGRTHSASSATRDEQWGVLERSLEVAKRLDAPIVRAFSFWRVADPASVRDEILDTLREATGRVARAGKRLGLENEHACNIATGNEAAWYLERIPDRTLGVIWDPGNIAALGVPPDEAQFRAVADRIHHVHVKDAVSLDEADGFTTIGQGVVDWPRQLRQLAGIGYDRVLSIETHFDLDGSRETASRSCATALSDLMTRTRVARDGR